MVQQHGHIGVAGFEEDAVMEEESEHPEHLNNTEESSPPHYSVEESSQPPNPEEEVHTPIEESVLMNFKVDEL